MNKVQVAVWNELVDRVPTYALVANVDLVVIRFDDEVSVLYGRCAHRGALMSDGTLMVKILSAAFTAGTTGLIQVLVNTTILKRCRNLERGSTMVLYSWTGTRSKTGHDGTPNPMNATPTRACIRITQAHRTSRTSN